MNIIIDILHPAHINLFKNPIKRLSINHNIIITCLDRGSLPLIVSKELPGYKFKVIGKHSGSKFSIIFEANMIRFFKLLFFVRKHKIDIGISFGSFLLGAVLRLQGKKNIHLSDDPERKINAFLEEITCAERYLPPVVEPKGKTKVFNALKEWSYLSPAYFNPDISVLNNFDYKAKNYIFIREVSTGSLNYKGQQSNIVSTFADQLKDYKVLLSLEDKSTINLYPKKWILLKEPLPDIHSLIYYSKCTISSGDSMARESAMLGVPGIYCGFREMKANNLLINRGMLLKTDPKAVAVTVNKIFDNQLLFTEQTIFRNSLFKEWDDVTEFIVNLFK